MPHWVERLPASAARRVKAEGPELPTLRSILWRIFLNEDVNFLVTNRIPRRLATLAMGRFARVESPTLARLSIAVWSLFADDLRLEEAKESTFPSLHACFVRELREGARPIDRDTGVLVSPCDAVVGAFGRVEGTRVFQAKGFPYTLSDFFGDEDLVERHRDGLYVTLRLKSNMYHRFHAPDDAFVESVRYVSGDTWNVNPVALARVEKLFCKNERAIVELRLGEGSSLSLAAVASILVGSVRVHAARRTFDLRYRGPHRVDCGGVHVRRGQELGYFESGSTIVLFARGPFEFARGLRTGATIRVGEALLRRRS
ncbi:MAG TPA: archaetidylserine decarboxylase [Polyangiaceae bacterium]|nr:archaetidylserine decarboxylase [Polyangiaceae bacterium]